MYCNLFCCSPSSRKSLGVNNVNNIKMPIVNVEQGALEGTFCTYSEENYVAFKGIPYAKPPIGKLRFKAPEPPDPWEGVLDASQHGPVCPQYNERMDRIEEGSEDCLYLNVYTKTLTPSEPLPVLFWIHGGGFYTGSGNSDYYGPEFFMMHDVILVTFNYRLEVLGFLCLDNDEVPGNAGLKDQVAALKWVNKNIAAFGGDPNNITIFGCSAGAGSSSLHLISKMSKGLFNKVIMQSGVCLNEWSYNIYPTERAFQLGKLLGKETEDTTELLDYLRNLPTSSLVKIQLPMLNSKLYDIADHLFFGPVIEKSDLKGDKFLSEHPLDLVKKGQLADVPIIVGYTSGEGMEIARQLPKLIPYFSSPGSVVPRELKLKWPAHKLLEADKKIRDYYFGGKNVSEEMMKEVVNLESDKLFIFNIVRYARYHSCFNTKPVYLYKFTAETERNYMKKLYNMDSIEGVCHSDEQPYLFHVTCLNIPLTEESKPIIQEFVRLWTNFASTGNPTPSSNSEQWKQFTDKERNCYVIGQKFTCVRDEHEKNIKFWEAIYEETDIEKNTAEK
ncbi:juvenile hormone esterase [Aphomia sociella]